VFVWILNADWLALYTENDVTFSPQKFDPLLNLTNTALHLCHIN